MNQYYIYILAKGRNSTFYVGVTNDLVRRVWEHKEKLAEGFTKKYDVDKLVYYEIHNSVEEAIKKEKLVKKWRRQIKMEVIERVNPEWNDLYFEIIK